MVRRILAAFGCIVAGGVLSQGVYRLAIMPRLAGWFAIPLRWYPALLGPVIVGLVAAGLVVRSTRETVGTAFLVALLALLPGGHDTDTGLNLVLGVVLTALALSVISWLAKVVRHRDAPV